MGIPDAKLLGGESRFMVIRRESHFALVGHRLKVYNRKQLIPAQVKDFRRKSSTN